MVPIHFHYQRPRVAWHMRLAVDYFNSGEIKRRHQRVLGVSLWIGRVQRLSAPADLIDVRDGFNSETVIK